MASNLTSTIFSSTYKDDYKDSNNFHRILFNSSRTLQARELTQSQTIIQKEIERFGNNIFKEGAMVNPGGVTVNNQLEYIKLAANTTVDKDAIIGTEFTGSSSGVKAKVIDALVDSGSLKPATLYVTYTDTTSGTAGTSPIKMSANESITNGSVTFTTQTTNTVDDPVTGTGTRASIAKGDFYVKGHFVNAQPQSKIISRYTTNPNKNLGFSVTESIVTSTDDETLFDNQGATPNRSAPGADRFKIKLDIATKDELDSDTTFCHVANVVNGVITSQPTGTNDYNRLNDLLATRTKEESGNYIAKQFVAKFDEKDDSSLTLNLSDGVAYINGYRSAPDTSLPIEVPRAQVSTTLNNQAIGANYGNYVFVQDSGTDGISLAVNRSNKGIPTFMVDSCTIYDNAATSGSAIGKVRLRAVEKGGNSNQGGALAGTYKYYLQNLEMYPGKNFRNAKSIGSSATSFFNPLQENGKTILREPENHDLFFTLQHDRPKAYSDFNLTVQRRITATTNSAGEATFGTLSNETYANTSDWVFSHVDSAMFVPSTVTGSGTTSAAITGGPSSKNIVALAYINKAVAATAVQRTKTLNTVTKTYGPTTENGVTFYNLAKPDIYEVTEIKDTNSGGQDISSKFILDDGQRDNHYGLGRLILKPGQTQSNAVYVNFKHFSAGSGQFFTSQSYPAAVPYKNIPNYIASNNREIELRNVMDFRHVVDSDGKFGTAGFNALVHELPKNTDIISADVEYYLPRRDKIVATEEGDIRYIYGASAFDLKDVDAPDGTLPLYNVSLNAFTVNDSDLTLEKIDAKRFTMADIGNVEKRLEKLEETTALSLMEVDTRNLEIIDSSGVNRTKSGFLVDNFKDHFQADTRTIEYRASIDPRGKVLRPSYIADNVKLMYDSATTESIVSGSSGVVQKGDNIYLQHSHVLHTSQDLATTVENVNPFAVITHIGHMELSPSSDNWYESKKKAARVLDGGVKIDKTLANNWNNWEWNWSGTEAAGLSANQQLSERTTESTVGNQLVTYKQTNFVASNEVIRTVIGTKSVDLALIPFMRSKKVFFRAQGMKPNSRVFAFFNGTPVADWVRPETTFSRYGDLSEDFGNLYNKASGHPNTAANLTTTDSGSIIGSFFIPNTDSLKFRTGDVEFKLLDISVNQDSVATSGARGMFTSRGVLETFQDTVLSTRNIKIQSSNREIGRRQIYSPRDERDWNRNPGTVVGNRFNTRRDADGTNFGTWSSPGGSSLPQKTIKWKDPLAQTFLIEDTAGIFLTKVDIFFSEKDANIPVAVSIRPTLNGVPTNQDMPGAIKFLPPSAVNVTAEGSSIDTVRAAPTTFEFEEPVYLSPYSEYAVVISAETNGYKAYVAESGEFVVNSTERRVTKQPSMGSLFKSQNGSTWTADQSSDLMFKLHRADFRNVGTAMLENTDVAPVLLDTDPISVTSGSTTYTVFQPGHGFMVGDDVILGGVTASDSANFLNNEIGGTGNSGVTGEGMRATRTITKVDWTGFQFTGDSSASGTVSGGGSALKSQQNMLFDQFIPNIDNITPPKTAISGGIKLHTGKSFGGVGETAYTIDTSMQPMDINKPNFLSAPRVIASRTNELKGSNINSSGNPNKRSALVEIGMGTNDSKVSPVIDLQRTSLTVINNMIDKQSSSSSSDGFSIPINYKAETDPTNGSSASKHITKTVNLAEDAVGLKVLISANLPANSSFDVYHKTAVDDVALSDVSWVLATRENTITTDDNPNIFRDHTFLIGGQKGTLEPFKQFKLKIVFIGYNSSKVPTIRDLRVIALAT